MTNNSILQIMFYLLVVLAGTFPLGWYIARVYQHKPCGADFVLAPCERVIYGLCGIRPLDEMNWKQYLSALLYLNLIGTVITYAVLRFQGHLPLNPQGFPGVPAGLAFNTAVSFITNTNWQAYAGENTMSYLSQSLALTVQNFLSAATGMAVLIAFIRGAIRSEGEGLGNFWVDITRGVLYILLPLSVLLAIALASQGVIQNLGPAQKIHLLQPVAVPPTEVLVTEQEIPMGPVASQIAIKQLGSNGGGFFNANSSHPFESPTPMANFLEMWAILLIPAALCYAFGTFINDRKQGMAILLVMFMIFVPLAGLTVFFEQSGNPALTALGAAEKPVPYFYPGGNMEGKETRFGITNSALWAAATTATSNGSVNAMLDSFTPLGGLVPLWLMHLGEIIFGGVGSGLYGMLMMIIITVFVCGLMIGRAPEYLGKKIGPFEMKMAAMAVLLMPTIVLILTAVAAVTEWGAQSIGNPTAHGFTEILYALTSMGNNNGSAFSGLNANMPFYNIVGGIEMLLLRFWLIVPVLAMAGSLARKKRVPWSTGTLSTHTFLFAVMLIAVILLIGALTFFPALCLGPIVEHITLGKLYGH